jgi:hypothetical protein
MAPKAFCFGLFRGMFGAGAFGVAGDTKPRVLELKNTAPAHGAFYPARHMAHFTAIGAGHLGRDRPMQVLGPGQPRMAPAGHAPLRGNVSDAQGKYANAKRQKKSKNQFRSHLFSPVFSL